MKKYILLNIMIMCFGGLVMAQQPERQNFSEQDLYEMDLEDLMNLVIRSASDKEESIFAAPVSSFSITRDQIEKAGASSIAEALRLCPEVIVRETSNGNYDIHLRGFDNLARFTGSQDQINLLTLVMVDNRPVFNYNQGGTFFESIPVDLVDVERIEVVKGPSSPLFGPNAVTGVINIITRRNEKDFQVSTKLETGSAGSTNAGLWLSKKLNPASAALTVSGNWKKYMRTDDLDYVYDYNTYSNQLDTFAIRPLFYGSSDVSIKKYAINGAYDYEKNGLNIRISAGGNFSDTYKSYLNNDFSALSPTGSRSWYGNGEVIYKNLKAHFSVVDGYDNVLKETSMLNSEYDYTNYNLVLDYDVNIGSKVSISPTFNYQSATYDDQKYIIENNKDGFFKGSKNITSYALSFRVDYSPIESLRLIGALRGDKFNLPDDVYLSYQFAATYQPNNKVMFRAVHSRSNSGAFLGNIYLDANVTTVYQEEALPFPIEIISIVEGNPEIKLTTVDLFELGGRMKFGENMSIDLTLFSQKLNNLNSLVQMGSDTTYNPVIPILPQTITSYTKYQALPLEAVQKGVTLSIIYSPIKEFQFSPFITLQETQVKNQPYYLTTMPVPGNIYDNKEGTHESTPSFYGGFNANILPMDKLNINLNAYFFGKHKLYHQKEVYPQMNDNGEIEGKILMNTKVAYRVSRNIKAYVAVKNILNDDSREHYGTDRMGRLFRIGINYNY